MKRTVIENTSGLWDRFPHMDIEISSRSDRRERDYSCFYDVGSASNTPLWGSTVMEESPFIQSFNRR